MRNIHTKLGRKINEGEGHLKTKGIFSVDDGPWLGQYESYAKDIEAVMAVTRARMEEIIRVFRPGPEQDSRLGKIRQEVKNRLQFLLDREESAAVSAKASLQVRLNAGKKISEGLAVAIWRFLESENLEHASPADCQRLFSDEDVLAAIEAAPPYVRKKLGVPETAFEAAKEARDPEAAKHIGWWQAYREAVQTVAEAAQEELNGGGR